MTARTRTLTITEDLIRAYSRRGNYHSDAAHAQALGLPGLVAQGVHVAAPAFGILLDEWGEDFLAHGELDWRFVGAVYAGESVEARVELHDETATVAVHNTTAGRAAVIGTARRRI